MTNEQFRTFFKMIIEIIRDSKDKNEAIKKIEALKLLPDYNSGSFFHKPIYL